MENARHSTRGLWRCVHGLGHFLVHVVAMVYHVSVDRATRHTTHVFLGDQTWLVLGHTDDAVAMDVAKRCCGHPVLVWVECGTDVAIGFLCTTKALLSATASRLSATSLLFDKANKDVVAVCSRMVSFSVLSALVSSLVRVGNATQDTTPWSFWVVAVVMAVHGLMVASVLAWYGLTVRIAATSLVDVLLVAWSGDVHHGLVTMALVGASVLVLQSRGERKQEVCVGENLQKLREP